MDLESGAVAAATVQPPNRGDREAVQETRESRSPRWRWKRIPRGQQAGERARSGRGGGGRGTSQQRGAGGVGGAGRAHLLLGTGWGRPRWQESGKEQAAVHGNRRRIRRGRGKRLLGQCGEKIERTFAHLHETGGPGRRLVRRNPGMLERLLLHVAASNLDLVTRQMFAHGTPPTLQDSAFALLLTLLRVQNAGGGLEITFPGLVHTSPFLRDSLESSKPLALATKKTAPSAPGS